MNGIAQILTGKNIQKMCTLFDLQELQLKKRDRRMLFDSWKALEKGNYLLVQTISKNAHTGF